MAFSARDVLASVPDFRRPLATVLDSDDLFESGLTSLGALQLMMAIEEQLGLTFPDEMLRRSTFQSIEAIEAAVATLNDF